MKRREFLSKAGIAGASLTALPIMGNSDSKLHAEEIIRLGIIGVGSRGGGLIPVIDDIPGVEVHAICDVLPFRLKDGRVKSYTDYRRVLEDRKVDAVLIATPFSMHDTMAIDAMDAGKHVYCEKTMAKGYDNIQSVYQKAKSVPYVFQTGHQYHSSRMYVHIVEQIKRGTIGKITAIDCQWNRNGNWRRPVPDPKLERLINWRMYREYSGGLVAELCSHQLDFSNWITEELPTKVMGVGGIDYWKDGRETFDNVHLIYSYPSGMKATFTCLTSNALDDYKVMVHGDRGTYIIDYATAWLYPEPTAKAPHTEWDGVSGATIPWDDGKGIPIQVEHTEPTKQALIDFRDSILHRKPPLSNCLTGSQTAVCVQMGLEAMYDEKIVYRDPKIIDLD